MADFRNKSPSALHCPARSHGLYVRQGSGPEGSGSSAPPFPCAGAGARHRAGAAPASGHTDRARSGESVRHLPAFPTRRSWDCQKATAWAVLPEPFPSARATGRASGLTGPAQTPPTSPASVKAPGQKATAPVRRLERGSCRHRPNLPVPALRAGSQCEDRPRVGA